MSRRDGFHVYDNGGLQRMLDDLHALSEELSPAKVRARLDPITEALTEDIRWRVPVRTGALRSSGRWSSEVNETEYEAEIRFGDGLDYGAYVLGRFVDGHHPWEESLAEFEERYESAIGNIWDVSVGR